MRHLGLRDDKRGRECDPRARDAYQDISECFASLAGGDGLGR